MVFLNVDHIASIFVTCAAIFDSSVPLVGRGVIFQKTIVAARPLARLVSAAAPG